MSVTDASRTINQHGSATCACHVHTSTGSGYMIGISCMQMIIASYTASQQGMHQIILARAIGALRMITVISYHSISSELQRSGAMTHRDAANKAAPRPPTAHTAVQGRPLLPRRSTYSVKPWRAECEVIGRGP